MNPGDLPNLFKIFKDLVSSFYEGDELPDGLNLLIDRILLAILVLLAIWGLLFVISRIKNLFVEEFWPLFYNQKERIRHRKRGRFAKHIVREIDQLNLGEEWKDYQYTELEAEIEAEGRRKGFTLIPFFQSTKRGLRREKTLSKALELSRERLILVEGAPGSGKSVALRHIAEKLAQRAMKSRSVKSIIPLYLNLKKLERSSEEAIDRNLIESFVKRELNRFNDRDIEQFLDEEFQRGIQEGTWLFLFDSFDELPEVLSSVKADEATKSYAEVIDDFLSGFNNCRGIIASRQFRGPKHLGWPRFRILPLENLRLELIRKAELDSVIEKELIGQLRSASQEIQEMTKNPMFLGILCENMRDGGSFPQNTHSVFENYLEKRLTRDKDRLKKRFNLEPSAVRTMAEMVAFCMSLDPNLGLSPTRAGIRNAMRTLEFRVPGNFDKFLNALEYLKLARSEDETIAGDSPLFTFSHRRFQEYFATCVVLSDLNRIKPRQLLTDGRWRETTVVIFQTQSPETFAPILAEARYLLDEILGNLSGLIDDPIGYVNRESFEQSSSVPKNFSWPPGLLNLLGLLQDGFINRIKDLSDDIQMQAGRILLSASVQGTLSDKKWSLEVAGITPQPVLLWLLRNAFSSESQWLKEVAYRQSARLVKIPDDISADIRRALLGLFSDKRLNKEFFSTYAHLSRLDKSTSYINILWLLRWIGFIDICLHIVSFPFLSFFLFHQFNDQLSYQDSFTKSFFLTYIISIVLILPIWSLLILRYFSSQVSSRKFSRDIMKMSMSIPWTNWERKTSIEKLNSPSIEQFKIFFVMYFRFIYFPCLWSIFAILAANTGKFTHPFWWPFLFFFPLLYFIAKSRNIIKYFITKSRNIIKMCISILQSTSTYIFVFFIVLFALFIKFISSLIFSDPNTILLSILIILIILFYVVFTFVFLLMSLYLISSYYYLFKYSITWLKYLIHLMQDWKKWKKWTKKSSNMTAQELLNLMDLYRTKHFIKKSIIVVREQILLIANKESEDLINELAIALEDSLYLANRKKDIRQRARQRLKGKKQKTSRKILKYFGSATKIFKRLKFSRKSKKSYTEKIIENYSGSEFFTSWLKQYTRKDKTRFINLGSEFLDEIYLLLEQLRARRKFTESSE